VRKCLLASEKESKQRKQFGNFFCFVLRSTIWQDDENDCNSSVTDLEAFFCAIGKDQSIICRQTIFFDYKQELKTVSIIGIPIFQLCDTTVSKRGK